ncbi:MAG TPA: heme exporter protein CcmB [Myxococcota bacterium]|nr:heme exporter protein CcmB [Myxococcota bacterium]
MSAFWAVLWKDLAIEWRSRDRFAAMTVFALLVVLVLYFAAPPSLDAAQNAHVPGLLWVAYVFAGVLGMNRAFAAELENDALSALALAPADRGFLFLGKAAASFLILITVQALAAVFFALAFSLDLWPVAPQLAAVAALGALGISCAGTLLAAIAVRTRYREVMLPLLLLPLLVPVLLGAVRATTALLTTGSLPWPPVQLLIVADAVYAIVSFLCFEYVLDE